MSDELKKELKEVVKYLRKNGFNLSADFIETFERKEEDLKKLKRVKK